MATKITPEPLVYWSVDYSGLPTEYRDMMRRWVEQGDEPESGFLGDVLRNDLSNAVGRADPWQLAHLRTFVSWIYNEPPAGCWGSPAKVDAWMKRGGAGGAGI